MYGPQLLAQGLSIICNSINPFNQYKIVLNQNHFTMLFFFFLLILSLLQTMPQLTHMHARTHPHKNTKTKKKNKRTKQNQLAIFQIQASVDQLAILNEITEQ